MHFVYNFGPGKLGSMFYFSTYINITITILMRAGAGHFDSPSNATIYKIWKMFQQVAMHYPNCKNLSAKGEGVLHKNLCRVYM